MSYVQKLKFPANYYYQFKETSSLRSTEICDKNQRWLEQATLLVYSVVLLPDLYTLLVSMPTKHGDIH